MKVPGIQYKVNVGRRNRYFKTLKGAMKFCDRHFALTGIVLSIQLIERKR